VKAEPHDGEVRNRENVTKVDCPFIVRSSFVDGSRANKKLKKDDSRKDTRVSITDKCEFLHNAECCPGIESQTNARTNSGFYTRHHINTKNLISVVKLIKLAGVKPALLRAILRQHLPDNVPISTTQLHNFRIRAKLLAQSGKLDDISESGSKFLRRDKAPETARRIDDGQDCGCNVKKKYSIQCRHEYKRDSYQFGASRF
jgi:hypothetical protein